MATLKIKPKNPADPTTRSERAPVRGSGMGVRRRPTLAEAQADRARRDAQPPMDRPDRTPPTRAPFRSDARPGSDPRNAPRAPRTPRPAERSAEPRRDPRNEQRSGEPRQERREGPPPRPSTRDREASADRKRAADSPRGRPPQERPPRRSEPPRGPEQQQQPRSGDRQADRPPIIAQPRFPVSPPARPPERPLERPFERPPQRPPEAKRRHVARPVRDDDDDDRGPFHQTPEAAPGSLRLSKRMSELGLASRREADEWIEKGWVRVDGDIVKELGSRVLPEQRITIDARAKFQQAQKVTVIINKPIGYVSGQAEDGYEPAVVLVKPENQWSEDQSGTRFLREHLRSLVPAGRLDIDSIGLLVLTQDGRIAKQLIGEDSAIEKEYLVRVAGPLGVGPASSELSPDDLEQLRHGLELDGEALKPAVVEWLNDDQLRFVLQEGKKRQIRRMCEAVGLKVIGLKRVRIGSVMLGDLPVGQWRYLRADESFA
ncbi:MAG: pseudouridine synthase [Burkholderiaceae bacterium]|nr:pseudouridine synthase [Burkholderiaceae bacterium]